MLIELNNSWARVVQATPPELRWLARYVSYTETKWTGAQPETVTETLLHPISDIFPAGLLALVERACAREGLPLQVQDMRGALPAAYPVADVSWLRDYQADAAQVFIEAGGRGIVKAPTGSGKCLGRGTPVMLLTGRVVPVEDVRVGDLLMGPDSLPRRVLSLSQGTGELYQVTPRKGAPWVCNDAHVLTVVMTDTGQVEDVALPDYLNRSFTWRHRAKLFRVGVDFQGRDDDLPVSPYFLGVWLGDGGKDIELNGVRVTKPDREIFEACEVEAARFGLIVRSDTSKACPTHRIVSARGRGACANPLKGALMGCFSGSDFVISEKYLCASPANRAELLAGLLDTDGHLSGGGYDIVQKRRGIADAVVWLARSLGLAAYISIKPVAGYGAYYRVSISGNCDALPLRIARKRTGARLQKKDALRVGFRVEPIGQGEYFGFQLDDDGRFLLGDFTVTHNTEILCALTRLLPVEWLMVVHRTDLVRQAADRYFKRTGERAGTFEQGEWKRGTCNLTVSTFQSIARSMRASESKLVSSMAQTHAFGLGALLNAIEGLAVDECHAQPADSFYAVSMALMNARFRLGLSGTPLDRGDLESLRAVGALGPVVYQIPTQLLVERGLLSKAAVYMVRCRQESWVDDWRKIYSGLVTESAARNQLVAEIAGIEARSPCLLFVDEVAQGRTLEDLLRGLGVKVKLVYGRDSVDGRQRQIKKLVTGGTEVLICTSIFQEGIDVPELKSIVCAGGKSSTVATLQRMGRGMRTCADGDDTFEVWDVLDVGQKWLEQHSLDRKAAYEREGHAVSVIDLR